MKLLCVVLGALVALATAGPRGKAPTCHVSEWQPWTACSTHASCRNEKGTLRTMSYSLPAAGHDAGRAHMGLLRYEKHQRWSAIRKCINDGTCPQYAQRESSGPEECVDGFAGEYPCRNMDMQSFVNFEDLGYGDPHWSDDDPQANDIWGWTDPESGDEYAIICLSGATSFVRVTDPQNPVTLAILYTATEATTWRDAKTIGHYAFIVSEAIDHGLQVYDLHNLRDMTGDEILTVEATVTYNRFGNAHNIVANEETGFLYVVGATWGTGDYELCAGGLHIVDVRDPMNPQFAGCYGGDGYVHDAECVIYRGPDVNYFGHEICFCYNEDTLTIVDVTEHDNAQLIGKQGYMNWAYTHQGWLTADHTTLLLDDELDEVIYPGIDTTQTFMWDVRSLENPTLISVFESTETAIDHNLYIKDDLAYQSNYEAGLRVLQIDQEAFSLQEVAYFDCLPSQTTVDFRGTWSNYPYFSSGNIIISSIDYGLFVLRPNMEGIRADLAAGNNFGQKTRMRHIVNAEEGSACPALVETAQCEPIKC